MLFAKYISHKNMKSTLWQDISDDLDQIQHSLSSWKILYCGRSRRIQLKISFSREILDNYLNFGYSTYSKYSHTLLFTLYMYF